MSFDILDYVKLTSLVGSASHCLVLSIVVAVLIRDTLIFLGFLIFILLAGLFIVILAVISVDGSTYSMIDDLEFSIVVLGIDSSELSLNSKSIVERMV
ncbi:hypothetical protein BCON_0208g00020 [Botryotinia convoluta]|uniref:Uncharacterized protein n=1 Tax=Botryotinia convoluta TaxID=54673 RepID=A0A4Z1HK59_9HELO|nr:hypothetical protein BCON_0208g00020 [Botryotinia convoluta]